MIIECFPVGLLKTISTEPWSPKMYNTNHGWHLLTAQVRAANDLPRQHCNHKQTHIAKFTFYLWTTSVCERRVPFRIEAGLSTIYQSSQTNLIVSSEQRAVTERVRGEYSVVVQAQQKSLEVKAKTGRLLKPIRHWRGEKTPRCVRCKVVLCLLSTITVLIMKEAQVAFTYCGSDSVFKSEGVNKCVIWDAATKTQFQTPFSSKTMRLISSITQKANEKGIVKLYHNVIQ